MRFAPKSINVFKVAELIEEGAELEWDFNDRFDLLRIWFAYFKSGWTVLIFQTQRRGMTALIPFVVNLGFITG